MGMESEALSPRDEKSQDMNWEIILAGFLVMCGCGMISMSIDSLVDLLSRSKALYIEDDKPEGPKLVK
jgi:hypothetical protein